MINMDYKFSNKVLALKPNAIREILKSASDPGVISLSAGNPAPDAFPVEAIREISERLLRENPIGVLQYGVSEGYQPLRDTLKAEIDAEAWESIHSDISRPFPVPSTGRIAVKIINHLGDEVMKVFRV